VTGDCIEVQVTSGAAGASKQCTANAGGVTQQFTVISTPPTSDAVNPFTFPTHVGVEPSSAQEGCTAIDGNTALSAVAVSGGTCTINGGACPGNLPIGGGTVCAQHTASAGYETPTNTVVTAGGQAGTFTSITRPDFPVCTDLPTASYIVNVDAVNVVFGNYCTGVISYAENTTPVPGLTLSGGTLTGVPTTVGEYVVTYQATNNAGTRSFDQVYHVISAEAAAGTDHCASRVNSILGTLGISVGGSVGTAVRSAICSG
jgi:hypothetical protein